jgi:hypothetical protein
MFGPYALKHANPDNPVNPVKMLSFSCFKSKRSGDHEPKAWDGGNEHQENQ